MKYEDLLFKFLVLYLKCALQEFVTFELPQRNFIVFKWFVSSAEMEQISQDVNKIFSQVLPGMLLTLHIILQITSIPFIYHMKCHHRMLTLDVT